MENGLTCRSPFFNLDSTVAAQPVESLLRRDLSSDYVAGNDHLHAAIQLPALGGAVVRDRAGLTKAARNHVVDRDVVTHQIVAHRGCPLLSDSDWL